MDHVDARFGKVGVVERGRGRDVVLNVHGAAASPLGYVRKTVGQGQVVKGSVTRGARQRDVQVLQADRLEAQDLEADVEELVVEDAVVAEHYLTEGAHGAGHDDRGRHIQ